MNIQDRINELFAKYLNGTCSTPEWEELLVLVSGIEETDTESLTAPLLRLWEQARNNELPSSAHLVNKEKMYAAITQEESVATTETKVKRIKWWRVAAAAAIAGLLISVGIIYMNRDSNQPLANKPVVIAPEKVRPGIDKAVLTLANGKQIILDSSATGAISKQGSTTVINFNGKLAYETGKDAGANTTIEPTYNTVNTARANQYQLVLPDGSKVWLNAVSSIRFPTAFTGNDRTVEITGEAYFEVAKDALKPFHVKVGSSDIIVLGTHFNVNAYADETVIKTSLLEGSIKITSAGKSGLLAPGQEASIANSNLKIAAGNVDLAVAWKNGYFQFDQAPLTVIMRQIGRWYDLDIKYAGAVPDRIFKGKIQRSLPLSGILNLLQKGDIHFKVEGKELIVTE